MEGAHQIAISSKIIGHPSRTQANPVPDSNSHLPAKKKVSATLSLSAPLKNIRRSCQKFLAPASRISCRIGHSATANCDCNSVAATTRCRTAPCGHCDAGILRARPSRKAFAQGLRASGGRRRSGSANTRVIRSDFHRCAANWRGIGCVSGKRR